ncbi:MAG: hypothetical protein KAT00_03720 [Planctomycetes bacterium]|nr:hypothetical protein [Planctomycetota bacterium]
MLERSANRCLVGAGHAELQIPAPLEPIKHIRHAKELFIFGFPEKQSLSCWQGCFCSKNNDHSKDVIVSQSSHSRINRGFEHLAHLEQAGGVLSKIFAHSSILDVAKSRFIALSVDFV